jgi:hypothetical protein
MLSVLSYSCSELGMRTSVLDSKADFGSELLICNLLVAEYPLLIHHHQFFELFAVLLGAI